MSQQPSTELKRIYKELICDALDKFPDLPSRTIARYLFANYPTVFLSVDKARDRVRHLRGTYGNENKKSLKDKQYVKS
jgi:hypothetical protein